MTTPQTSGYDSGRAEEPGSLGEIISDISDGLSRLFRQEVELAKAELRTEATKAGKVPFRAFPPRFVLFKWLKAT